MAQVADHHSPKLYVQVQLRQFSNLNTFDRLIKQRFMLITDWSQSDTLKSHMSGMREK